MCLLFDCELRKSNWVCVVSFKKIPCIFWRNHFTTAEDCARSAWECEYRNNFPNMSRAWVGLQTMRNRKRGRRNSQVTYINHADGSLDVMYIHTTQLCNCGRRYNSSFTVAYSAALNFFTLALLKMNYVHLAIPTAVCLALLPLPPD